MSKIYTCSICDSEFNNSHSLNSHRHKYHPKGWKSKTDRDLEQKMEYKMDDQFSNSSIQNELYHNKAIAQDDESSQNEININGDKSLSSYIERLPKLFSITGDVLNDIKYLKKAVNVK